MRKRVIVAGGRDFADKGRLTAALNWLLWSTDIVVSGCAKGADRLAIEWARDNGAEVVEYPADWDKHGKAAGAIRNLEMAQNADVLIAFWDGKSKGTKHMIEAAHQRRLETHVYYY